MARSYRPVVRDQEFLLPPNMADWLPEDHLVWFVLDVVEQLDTSKFHQHRRLGRQGRQAFDPDMLLALLVYAYAVGERSSRRIEQRCVEDVAFRVLCGQDSPDHTTIARFRAEHHDGFIDLFTQVLRLCADAGMVKVGTVSIDGTKIAANAARSANRSPDWVREEARRVAGEVVAEADATDEAEDDDDGDDTVLPPGLTTRKGRAANLKKAIDELDRRDTAHAAEDVADQERARQIIARAEHEPMPGPVPNGVDPVAFHKARIRRFRRKLEDLEGLPGEEIKWKRTAARQGLKNAEQARDHAEAQMAAGEIDLRGPAARARDRRAAKARARGALGDAVNTTDPESRLMTDGSGGGSVQGYNAQVAVTDDHLILGVHLSQDSNDTNCFTPTLDAATAQANRLGKPIEFVLADAGYFTDANLTTTGPERLIAPGKNRDVHTDARDEPTTGPPSEDATPKDAMRHRLRDPANAERYKRRSATVEPVIGHLKDQTRLRRFAQRGLEAATAELNLAAAVVNLGRLHQLGTATG